MSCHLKQISLFLGIFVCLGFEIFVAVKLLHYLFSDIKYPVTIYAILLLIIYSLHKLEMVFNGELKKTVTTEKN